MKNPLIKFIVGGLAGLALSSIPLLLFIAFVYLGETSTLNFAPLYLLIMLLALPMTILQVIWLFIGSWFGLSEDFIIFGAFITYGVLAFVIAGALALTAFNSSKKAPEKKQSKSKTNIT